MEDTRYTVNGEEVVIHSKDDGIDEVAQKHLPNIAYSQATMSFVRVTVGIDGAVHPQEDDHYIEFIRVFINDNLINKAEFAPSSKDISVMAIANAAAGSEVVVQTYCNKHGLYEDTMVIA